MVADLIGMVTLLRNSKCDFWQPLFEMLNESRIGILSYVLSTEDTETTDTDCQMFILSWSLVAVIDKP